MTAIANYDVAIIGAGPAGLATAICCAGFGSRVCVLERGEFPRLCVGESVHPGAVELFRRLGVLEEIDKRDFVRFTGIWNLNDGRLFFNKFGGPAHQPWRGFQIWRFDFDRILLQRALTLGAEFLSRCQPVDVTRMRSGVSITAKCGIIQAKIIVDATGRNSWLNRHWNGTAEVFSRPLIARYGYREGECRKRRENPLFALNRNGWEWTACVKPNLYQWISVCFDRSKEPKELVPKELRNLRPIGKDKGADVTWRIVSRCATPYHFSVGDAASVLDPASSHGIIKALASGILAAECIKKVLVRSPGWALAIKGYCAWQQRWFDRDLRRLKMALGNMSRLVERQPD